ncbi:MAG: YqaE/Pmp3 family membrane protein [Verrucomicrobiota bacterium]
MSAPSQTTNKLLLIILAFLLPPLAVGLKNGIGGSFFLNLILTIIFWLPGVIHALIVVL